FRFTLELVMTEVILNVLNSITVEPILLVNALAHTGTDIIKESLQLDKSCLVTLNYTDDICQHLQDHKDESIKVQQASSTLNGAALWVQDFLPVLLLAYIGPLADRWGRKPFLYLALIGGSLETLSYLLNSIFFNWPAYVTLVGPLLLSLSGGVSSFQMLMFVYMADITNLSNRTLRIGILKVCMSYGRPFGRLIMGQLLAVSGYVTIFSTSLLLYILCLIYTYVRLKESLPETKRNLASSNGLKDIYILPYNAGKVVFRRRPGYKRLIIILTVLSDGIALFCNKTPLFLFFRYIFGWDATVFSNWMFYKEIIAATAQLLTVSLLVRVLRWSDYSLAMTSNCSEALMFILLAQMTTPLSTESYLQGPYKAITIAGPLLGMLNDNMHIAVRAIISKSVDTPAELGKLFAAQGMIESLSMASAGPIYAAIYNATIGYFTGTIMMFSAILLF
ncbi:unnamed protein product, partial [Meganyctiphanes norvegica]